MELILASSNQHKIDEIKNLVQGLDIQIRSKAEIGCTEEIPETGQNLHENAIIKAKYIHEKYHVNCFAEDTGLEVEYLDGAPGVHTARYAGEAKDPQENMDKLLRSLKDATNRNAQFRTVISLILEDQSYTFEGIIRGTIALKKSGNGGFGYDPIFIPNGHNLSFASLNSSIKQSISHRAKAVQKLIEFLKSLNN